MARFVIDAPTLVYLVDAGLRVDGTHQVVAPSRIRSEALELLLHEVATGRRNEPAALATHEKMTEMKMRLLADRVSRRTAWNVARENGWTTLRDAEYIAITRLQADALATVDDHLAELARPLVAVASVDALFSG